MKFIGRHTEISQHILLQRPALEELKSEYSFADMHVHTKYSHDCKTPVPLLIKKAEMLGLGMAITDHKQVEGAVEASRHGRVLVIPGIEIASSEDKEILLYFYSFKDLVEYYDKFLKNRGCLEKKPTNSFTKSIKSVKSDLTMAELVERADRYSCLKSIPHPYVYAIQRISSRFFAKKHMRDTLRRIDAVEVVSSPALNFMNKKARKWALKRGKAFTAGSDAHILQVFGSALVACKADNIEGFLDAIKKKKNIVLGEEIRFSSAIRSLIEIGKSKRQTDWNEIS